MEVPITRDRKNPVHRTLVLLLDHLKISQPEVHKEATDLQTVLDSHFQQSDVVLDIDKIGDAAAAKIDIDKIADAAAAKIDIDKIADAAAAKIRAEGEK